MVAKTRKTDNNSPRKLQFHEKLVGKGLATDALLKKLKILHTELAEFDQENVDQKSLDGVCKELISTSILLHKDKGVKAFAACCLADLLRLYAPDAPYTGPELRDIFQFFFRQLSTGLKGPDSPYYNEYFHLLESLSTVKSVVLVCDLPQADELMVQIFRDFFGLVRNDLAKNIEMFMTDILIALIDECQSLPSDVLDAIMAQFMDKIPHMDQPAYRMAVDICNATSDKLQRHVCQYFTDNIVQHSQDGNFDEVQTAHELIKRLNRSCPSLLHNVIPQLEEELRVEEVQLRHMATRVLGDMFADKGSSDLERKYASTWNLWLARMNDKATTVRVAFVEACKGLLLHHRSELRRAIENALELKLCDPDDRIRAAVCKVYSQLDYETSLHHISEKSLRAVGMRTLDKKQNVRHEALLAIGKLYSNAYPEIENNDPSAIKQFAWIPEQILHSITATLEVKDTAEQVIAEFILPMPGRNDDEVVWVDRLLTTMNYLDSKALNVLMSISGLKKTQPIIAERFVQCCIENNGGVIDEDEEGVRKRLSAVIKVLSGQYSDPQKASEDFYKFAKMNEQRLYKLLKVCMDPQTDIKNVVKSTNEFMKRIEESSSSIQSTLSSFIRQASLRIINQSSIPTLLRRIQQGDPNGSGQGTSNAQSIANHALSLMTVVSKHSPIILKPHVGELIKAVHSDKHPRLVEVCLQAIASISKYDPSLAPIDKRVLDKISRFIEGSNRRHAKFASQILACSKKKDDYCSSIIETIAQSLSEAEPAASLAQVAALAEIVRSAPDAFEQRSDVIMECLLKKVLMAPCHAEKGTIDTEESDEEWIDDHELPPLAQAKILVLKVCRRRCLVHAQSELAAEVAGPVLKLMFTLLENGGSVKEEIEDDLGVKSRMRLQAAWSLVQLATIPKLNEALNPNFVLLAITDSCFHVRLRFLTKVIGLLHLRKLPPRFNLIPFLTVHDPEDEVHDKARGYISLTFRRATADIRLAYYERLFLRLLHLLAHHPDFGITEPQLREQAKYVNVYIMLIATNENISLLYHLAQKIKTVRDAESDDYDKNLYCLSELAQDLIQKRAKAQSWSLTSYPDKVKLPPDIFRALPNSTVATEILKTVYLSEQSLQSVHETSKPATKPRPERKISLKKVKPQKQDRSKTTKRSGRAIKRRRNEESDDDNDDDDSNTDNIYKDDHGSDTSMAAQASKVDDALSQDDSMEIHERGRSSENEEILGRGARTRAKAKAQRKAKKTKTNELQIEDN